MGLDSAHIHEKEYHKITENATYIFSKSLHFFAFASTDLQGASGENAGRSAGRQKRFSPLDLSVKKQNMSAAVAPRRTCFFFPIYRILVYGDTVGLPPSLHISPQSHAGESTKCPVF